MIHCTSRSAGQNFHFNSFNRSYYFASRSVRLSSYIFPTGFVWNALCWQLYDQIMMTPPSMTDVSIHNDCKVPTIILRNNQQTLSTTIAFIQSLKSDTENIMKVSLAEVTNNDNLCLFQWFIWTLHWCTELHTHLKLDICASNNLGDIWNVYKL